MKKHSLAETNHSLAKQGKPSIEELDAYARNQGGKCFSSKYVNAKHKIKWRCKNNHTWNASYSYVKLGYWCPICAKKTKK